MSKELKSAFNDDLKDKITKEINDYATTKGYNDGNDLNNSIADGLNSTNPNTRDAAVNAAVETAYDLLPKIFNQVVENYGDYNTLSEQMAIDFEGFMSEGNGTEFFNNLTEVPESTNVLNGDVSYLPRGQSGAYSQTWSMTYLTPDGKNLSPDAYAFKQNITIQQTRLLTQFRTGAGIKFLLELALTLYESLQFTQYTKWATTKFTLPANTNINGRELVTTGTGEDAFNSWIEIFTILNKMCALNNTYNYNGAFKKIHTCRLKNIVLYMSNKTYTTFKHNLLSQLYNNGQFKDILENVKIYVPSYKLKWLNITNANIDIDGVSVAPGGMIDAQIGKNDIPSGLIWTTSNEEYVDDETVFIMTDKSFKWYKQTQLEASQYFANNFSETKALYELGAMSYSPIGKIAVYKNVNLNKDPNII